MALQLIELLHADCPAPPAGPGRCGHTFAAPLLGASPREFLDQAAAWAGEFLRQRHGRRAALHRASLSAEVAWSPGGGGLDVAPTDVALLAPDQWAALRTLMLADPALRGRCVVRVRFADGAAGAAPRWRIPFPPVGSWWPPFRRGRGRGARPEAVELALTPPPPEPAAPGLPTPERFWWGGEEDEACAGPEEIPWAAGLGTGGRLGVASARDGLGPADPVLFEGPGVDEWAGLPLEQDEQGMWELRRSLTPPPPWSEHDDLLHGGFDSEFYYELAGVGSV